MEDTTDIIEAINATNFVFEVRELRRFTAYLKDSNEEVAIVVSDSGSADSARYTASAQVMGSETRVSASNPEHSVKAAIFGIHWNEIVRRGTKG